MTTHQPLDGVEIRRFRGLSELDLNGLGSFNVLLGANDVGKTSVLEAIFLMTGFVNMRLPMTVQDWRSLSINTFDDLGVLFHGFDLDRPIDLVAHSTGAVVRRQLQISAPYADIETSTAPRPRQTEETPAPSTGGVSPTSHLPSCPSVAYDTVSRSDELDTICRREVG